MVDLIQKVKDTIARYRMTRRGDKILIGVSGGPDSVTLLHILNILSKELDFSIHVGHLDHMFRGEESRQDRLFVEELAGKLNLPFSYEETNVPEIIKTRDISPEEAARSARYEFFKKIAIEYNLDKVAIAHTKDDQAETVLMRFIKGSGVLGLTGIPAYKELNGLIVIRPLIEVWRSEIEEFINSKKLFFRQDSSNLETVFLRNRIRKNLIPYLEKDFNPNIRELLNNLADNLRAELDFLELIGERKFKSISHIKDRTVHINFKKFLKLHEALQRRIIRLSIKRLKGDLRKISFQHWKEIEELIKDRPNGSIVDLPSGVSVLKKKGEIICFLK